MPSFFLPLFLVFLMLCLPVVFGLLAAPEIILWLTGQERDIVLLCRNYYEGMNSFPLMAIPFFMLAGELMNRGGISARIVGFAQAMVGHFRGGLAQVNGVDSMLFAGISGSAVADVSALGSIIIPLMEEKRYPKPFSAAITAASAIGGEVFMGTQLGAKGDECLAGVADGTIDIYISTSGGASGLFPCIHVLDLPYLMSDDRVAEEVLTGTDFTAKLRAMALADSGDKIRLMTIGNTGGWRNYANTQRRIAGPGDLAGLKMRTVPADLAQTLATTLGASPRPIPWPELFTSLQTGVVEDTANGTTDIMSMKSPTRGSST